MLPLITSKFRNLEIFFFCTDELHVQETYISNLDLNFANITVEVSNDIMKQGKADIYIFQFCFSLIWFVRLNH